MAIKMKHKKIYITLIIILSLPLSIIAINECKDWIRNNQKQKNYAKIIPLIGLSENDSFEHTADKVRQFLFEHTKYSEGKEFHDIWGNDPLIAQRIIERANAPDKHSRVPLECSSRSNIFESIMITLGYNARSITAHQYSSDYYSHTFSEIQNPETGQWHVQDVQYNTYWRLINENGKRASINDLISNEYHMYEPCIAPNKCGWNMRNRENNTPTAFVKYLDLASIKDYQRSRRPLIVNTNRFDLNKPQKVGEEMLTYCKYRAKNCRDDIIKY